MRILSNDNQGLIDIDVREKGPDGSVRLSVKGSCTGFSGEYTKVWLQPEAIERFEAHLSELERTRQGKAELESISPNEFKLEIFSVDSVGHIALSFRLQRPIYAFRSSILLKTEIGFELDAGRMAQLLRDVKELRKKASNQQVEGIHR
jgi:hypothetical protein